MSLPASLTPAKLLFFVTGLTGSFLVSLSTQFASVNIADIQAGSVASSFRQGIWMISFIGRVRVSTVPARGPGPVRGA